MARKLRLPTYRLHKASGQAIVVLHGRSFYLGRYNTEASKAEYKRIIAEWLAGNQSSSAIQSAPPINAKCPTDLTITELAVAYFAHVERYYVKDGEPTSEQDNIRQALRFLRHTHGHIPVVRFGPLALQAVRESMINHPISRKIKAWDEKAGAYRQQVKVYHHGLARRHINRQVERIKRMFKWAAANELVPVSIYEGLKTVEGLRKDRSTAREKDRVKPVSVEAVQAVLGHVPSIVARMIQVQLLCGSRPQDIVQMKPGAIDTSGETWIYRPQRHKTEHLNCDRLVFLGPRAQTLLRPCLEGAGPDEYIFSPRRSEADRHAEKRRKLGKESLSVDPDRTYSHLRQRYDVASYRRAIRRACEQLQIPIWCPHRLRHTAGTIIREKYGVEASQVVLGEADLKVTEIYAEKNLNLARKVIAEIG